MSDSTNPLNQVSQSAIQREVTINENFAQTGPASIFAYNAVTSAALTWGYMGGRLDGTLVASGTVALTGSTTNYIVAHRTTLAVTVSTATTNWNNTTTYGRLYLVVTGAGSVTSYEDHRAGGIFVGGAAPAGAVPTGTGFRHVTSGAEDAAAVAVNLSGADVTGTIAIARMPALTGAVVLSPAYAGTLTVDLTSYSAYSIIVVNVGTLTGNITFNVTNGADGQIIRARFTQDGTGSRLFTGGAQIRYSVDTPAPTLTTAINKMDRLAFEWHAGAGKADLVAVNKGY